MAECLRTHHHFPECVHLDVTKTRAWMCEYRYGKVSGHGYEVKLLQSIHGGYHAH